MVECYKNSLPLFRANWPLLSVLFGSLSTKGTYKMYIDVHNRRLIIGLWRWLTAPCQSFGATRHNASRRFHPLI